MGNHKRNQGGYTTSKGSAVRTQAAVMLMRFFENVTV